MEKKISAGSLLCMCLLLAVSFAPQSADAMGKAGCDCCAMSAESAASATELKSPEGEASCQHCGMDRGKFARSRMLVEYGDGSSVATCSIRCLAVELNASGKKPSAIRVGDYSSRKLIDAERAFWVVGGDKRGVMSSRAKWAFERKADAEAFIAANNGTLANFEDALKAAYQDLNQDASGAGERQKTKGMMHMEHK